MAYAFNATDQYLEVDSAPVTAPPFMVSLWFKANSITTATTVFWLGDKDATSDWFYIHVQGNVAGDPMRFQARAAGSSSNADTTTGYSAGTWHNVTAIAASTTDRAVWLDGAGKGTSAVSRVIAGTDRIAVGRNADATPSNYYDGELGEFAVWNEAPSTAGTPSEVSRLAAGVSATLIRPHALVFYKDLIRDLNRPYIGADWTNFGGATVQPHVPGIIYPSQSLHLGVPSAAPPPGANPHGPFGHPLHGPFAGPVGP